MNRKKSLLKTMALSLACALLLTAAGCGPSTPVPSGAPSSAAPAASGEAASSGESQPDADPAIGQVNTDRTYTMMAGFSRPADFNGNFFQFKIGTPMNLVYEGMFTLVRTTDTILPKLCESYSSEGNKTTFHLRQDAKWSDGEAFTSKDVKAYFDVNNGHNLLHYLESAAYPDDYTVVLEWAEPMINEDMKMLFVADGWHGTIAYHLYQEYADRSAAILDEALAARKPGERGPGPYGVTFTEEQSAELGEIWNAFVGSGPDIPVGTGPYMVDSMTDTDMILVKNPYFYDADKVTIEKVVMKNADTNTALALLSSGQVDHYPGPLPVDITDNILAQNPNMVFYPMFDPACQGLFFNTLKEPFNSLEVRQAISLVLNKTPVREAASIYSKEFPQFSSIGIVPSTLDQALSPGLTEKMKDYTTNGAEAEQLLQSAGWSRNADGKWQDQNGRSYEWNIVVGPNSGMAMLNGGMVVADQLNKFGFNVVVTNSEVNTFYEKSSLQEHDMIIDFTDVSWSFVNAYDALNHYYNADPGKWAGLWSDGQEKSLLLKDYDGVEFDVYQVISEMTTMSAEDFQKAVDRIVWATNENAFCVNLYQQTTGVWENKATITNLPLDPDHASSNFMRLPETLEEKEAVACLNLGFAAGGTKFIGMIEPK